MSQPYDIRTDVKYGQLKLIDVPRELREHQPWFNQALTTVNDAVVRLGIFKGEFHWHKHAGEDEMFFVLEGTLLVDVEGHGTATLGQHQGYTVPRGVMHRTRAPERAAVLMIEKQGVTATGD